MAIFGKKKLSLDEIIKGIEELSDEEKAQVISAVQPAEPVEEPVEDAALFQGEEPMTETVEEAESPADGEEVEEVQESEEVEAPVEETAPIEEEGAPVEESETLEELDVRPDVPTETPESTATETETPNNYDELIAAQNARIDSLESAITAMMERMEQMVSNFDNQNFGYSPQNYGEEESSSRISAVMQGYAPRRFEQYK